jgi:peptidoglycan L-alanyl-D-glutamate endopeptidase CwlK
MASLDKRQTDLQSLHPAIRDKVRTVREKLNSEGHAFEVFEAFRSPERQRYLYEQGRTRPGNRVTNAGPWSSYHQYGLAADFVLKTNGQWDWSTSGPNSVAWKRLHEIGRKHGLEPLSWELPHLQMAGLNVGDLRAGRFPPGGDEVWADGLEAAIAGWNGSPGAPPAPKIVARPALTGTGVQAGTTTDGGEISDEADRPGVPPEIVRSSEIGGPTNNFARVQPFVDKWEGGYVDHPSDPGGATNMGITLATLARWRGHQVTKQDVKALTREEAWRIFKSFYFDVVEGDSLPLPLAAIVYDAAVLHGPGRSAEFLQTALNQQGTNVKVDGAIGPETIKGVSAANLRRLLEDCITLRESYLRGRPHFPTFGKGWINRINDLRKFAAHLPISDVSAPQVLPGETVMPSTRVPTENLIEIISKFEELMRLLGQPVQTTEAAATVGPAQTTDDVASRIAAISGILTQINTIKAGKLPATSLAPASPEKVLTPVNAALGTTIGKLLDGYKTGIGVIGSVLTALVAPTAETGIAPGALAPLAAAVPFLQQVMLGLAAWGVLGMAEKWIKRPQQ